MNDDLTVLQYYCMHLSLGDCVLVTACEVATHCKQVKLKKVMILGFL